MHVAVDELPGRLVIDATGRVLGVVDRLLVDVGTWAVDLIRLRLRRGPASELGMNWTFWRQPRIDIPAGMVMAAADTVILRATVEDLHGLVPAPAPHARHEFAHS